MTLYFAYGANMDRAGMFERCPRSTPLGRASLRGFRLAVMREGWLTVVREPGDVVEGVLWDVAPTDVDALDSFESVGEGLYTKALLPVEAGEQTRTALVYLGANAGPGRPNEPYLTQVLASARAWDLSEAGLAALERLRA